MARRAGGVEGVLLRGIIALSVSCDGDSGDGGRESSPDSVVTDEAVPLWKFASARPARSHACIHVCS